MSYWTLLKPDFRAFRVFLLNILTVYNVYAVPYFKIIMIIKIIYSFLKILYILRRTIKKIPSPHRKNYSDCCYVFLICFWNCKLKWLVRCNCIIEKITPLLVLYASGIFRTEPCIQSANFVYCFCFCLYIFNFELITFHFLYIFN